MVRVGFSTTQTRPRMKTIWIMVVLVIADGKWREWTHQYSRLEECLEAKEILTHRREHLLTIRCESRQVKSLDIPEK
jgi:hypothetical protein